MIVLLIPFIVLAAIVIDWWSVYKVGVYVIAQFGILEGVALTLLLLIAAFFLGVATLRSVGPAIAAGVARDMHAGRVPTRSVIDGLLLGVAGVLLIMPGFVSDVIALALILPGIRAIPRAIAGLYAGRRARVSTSYNVGGAGASTGAHRAPPRATRGGDDVVDVETDDYRVE